MKRILFISLFAAISAMMSVSYGQSLRLNDSGLFVSRGVEVSVCNGSDGIRVSQKDRVVSPFAGVRVDGSAGAELVQNNLNLIENKMEVKMSGPDNFSYYLKVSAARLGLEVSVYLTEPLPEKLEGRARFSMEFVPSLYYGRNCLMDGRARIIPEGVNPGHTLILAPENDELRIEIKSDAEICCSAGDERFEISSIIPSGRTGNVLVWYIEPSYDSRWAQDAVLDWSRIGYLNGQEKLAVITIDARGAMEPNVKVYKISDEGYRQQVYQPAVKRWGSAGERSDYVTANFSAVREDGVYCIGYGDVLSEAFPISGDVLEGKWYKALQMLPESIASGAYDSAEALDLLVDLWETLRPELDFNGNGVPDAVDAIGTCVERVKNEDPSALDSAPDRKFRYVAALAGAGRVLKDFAPGVSVQAQNLAWQMWDASETLLSDNKMDAVIQFWLLTGNDIYRKQIAKSLGDVCQSRDGFCRLLKVYPLLDAKLRKKFSSFSPDYLSLLKKEASSTPYGVPSLASADLLAWTLNYYQAWNQFPEDLEPETILRGLNAIYGRRTYADDSFLTSMDTCSLIRFIKLSLAADEIAKYVNSK